MKGRGQATLEAALALPLFLMLTLVLLQLGLLAQARVLTEYAAYEAARAGIVWNGNPERMHEAALWALLPTLGQTNNWRAVSDTYQSVSGQSETAAGRIRVEVENPVAVTPRSLGEELEFDAPYTYPESPGLQDNLSAFFNPGSEDARHETDLRATLLSIRLRYLYELRVPFANALLFLCWKATHALVGKATGGPRDAGGPPASARFFIPVSATHTLPMQSSFYRKWLTEQNAGSAR